MSEVQGHREFNVMQDAFRRMQEAGVAVESESGRPARGIREFKEHKAAQEEYQRVLTRYLEAV